MFITIWSWVKDHPYISITGIILSGILFVMQFANEIFTLKENLTTNDPQLRFTEAKSVDGKSSDSKMFLPCKECQNIYQLGQENIEKNYLTSPIGNNAYEKFNQLEALHSQLAELLLDRISARYKSLILSNIEQGNKQYAETLIKRLKLVAPQLDYGQLESAILKVANQGTESNDVSGVQTEKIIKNDESIVDQNIENSTPVSSTSSSSTDIDPMEPESINQKFEKIHLAAQYMDDKKILEFIVEQIWKIEPSVSCAQFNSLAKYLKYKKEKTIFVQSSSCRIARPIDENCVHELMSVVDKKYASETIELILAEDPLCTHKSTWGDIYSLLLRLR